MMKSTENMIFVFGSNLSGYHGAGAAKFAMRHFGAVYGKGIGHVGRSYAIPTKDKRIRTLSIGMIAGYVNDFIKYAKQHPELTFQVTQIGCGLAGYTAKDIAPLFKDAPENCLFDEAWKPYLDRTYKYWGNI